jgi:DNA polymerase
VPGEGPLNAALMIVGEQPGDAEDLAGRPFVGPAGKLLSTALERAGIERGACYLTNAVKHFKFEPRGKRRIHKSPNRQEIDHCRWWLDQERATIKPRVILALGVSAVRGITGQQVTLSEVRSRPIPLPDASQMVATVHPAYLLRLTAEADKRTAWMQFLSDLRLARDLVATPALAAPSEIFAARGT